MAVIRFSDRTLRLVDEAYGSALSLDMRAFLADCEMRRLSPNTLRIYSIQLAAFHTWAHGKASEDVTPQDLRIYFLSLKEAGHNPGGQHQAFRVLRTFFRWLVVEGVLQTDPTARLRPPQLREEPLEPVSMDYVRALLRTCDGRSFLDLRDAAMILCLLDTGARAGEFLAVNVDDLDLDAGAIALRETKNRKMRVAFVGARTRKAIVRYLRTRGECTSATPLWCTVGGKRLTYAGLRQVLRRRAGQAGVPEVGAHAFRRAFCLALLRGGADVFSVQKLAGHSDLSTTRRYLRQVTDDLRDAHAKAGPVDNLL